MKNEAHRIVLYSRNGCHLCDKAESLLASHGIRSEKIDIDTDPKLIEQFTTCVPVVEIDGKIRFRGRVDPMLLRRILQTWNGYAEPKSSPGAS
jgi:glutaredoxin